MPVASRLTVAAIGEPPAGVRVNASASRVRGSIISLNVAVTSAPIGTSIASATGETATTVGARVSGGVS